MSNFRSTVQDTSLAIAVRGESLVADAVEGTMNRLRRQEGQTAAEYMGILLVVSVIIVALATSDIGTKVKDLVYAQIDKIAGGGGGAPAGGGG